MRKQNKTKQMKYTKKWEFKLVIFSVSGRKQRLSKCPFIEVGREWTELVTGKLRRIRSERCSKMGVVMEVREAGVVRRLPEGAGVRLREAGGLLD